MLSIQLFHRRFNLTSALLATLLAFAASSRAADVEWTSNPGDIFLTPFNKNISPDGQRLIQLAAGLDSSLAPAGTFENSIGESRFATIDHEASLPPAYNTGSTVVTDFERSSVLIPLPPAVWTGGGVMMLALMAALRPGLILRSSAAR